MQRDKSCTLFKELEKSKEGSDIALPMSLKRISQTAIAHACNADFFSNGTWLVKKMQETIDSHVRLCKATGAKIQEGSFLLFAMQNDIEMVID